MKTKLFPRMNSIRKKILMAFFFLGLLIGPFLTFSYISVKKVDQANSLKEQVAFFNMNRLKASAVFSQILNYDAKLDSFHINKSTKNLENYNKHVELSKDALKKISGSEDITNEIILKRIDRISQNLVKLDEVIKNTIRLKQERGFKDYGLEGAMRNYIHELESDTIGISLSENLQLRRREKDFFLRRDTAYITQVNTICDDLIRKMQETPEVNEASIKTLNNYRRIFNQIAEKEVVIGNEKTGLIYTIDYLNNELDKKVFKLYNIVDTDWRILVNSIKSYIVLFFIITVIFAILFSFVFSGHIARPIKMLIKDMDAIAKNNFVGEIEKRDKVKIKEIDKLIHTYNKLVKRIKNQIKDLNDSNENLNTVNTRLVESENELKEASRIKDRFFSIISHDLRGHSGHVHSLATILNEDEGELSEKETKVFVKYLVDSSRNLQLLLENLLNWAKSQMNDLTISKKAFDINTLVQRNVDLFHENAIRKNVEVSYASTDVPKVYADKDMIDFVLRNLLSNALKFTKTGGSITFNVSEIDQFLEIEISDTGVGMTPEQIEDLLKSNKENKTTLGTDDEEGSGLGFAICLDFIKRNDGSIQIESEPGKGSKFIFSIPTSLTKEIILSS